MHETMLLCIGSCGYMTATVEMMADWYFYNGSPIHAACCHLVVNDHKVFYNVFSPCLQVYEVFYHVFSLCLQELLLHIT